MTSRLDYLRRWEELHTRALEREAQRSMRYVYDPVAWARDMVHYPPGGGLTHYQDNILTSLVQHHRVAVRGPHGLGKALSLDMRIPTPCGWSTIGDLLVGDEIFDENGQICHVIDKSEIFTADTYEVTFTDGTIIKSHGQHEWNAIDVYHRPKGVSDWRDHWQSTRTVTTEYMSQHLKSPGGQLRWRIPTARPLDLPEARLPIDPYLLGVWLGDGTTSNGQITLNRADSSTIASRIPGGHFPPSGEHDSSRRYSIPGLTHQLKALNVLGDKHIPMQYQRASIAQRRELIRGLWDTDGYTQGGGCDEITLTCKRLALDVADVLRSLGLVVRIKESDAKLNGRVVSRRWRIAARFDFRPYHLERYPWTQRGAQGSRHTQRTIASIRRVEDEPTQCISVSSRSHLYLAGESLVPTHNSFSAAVAVLWFANTREAQQWDWKVIITASAWRQISGFLFPEIRRWARRLNWAQLGRAPYDERRELQELGLKLRYGSVLTAAATDPAKLEGAHADSVLVIFDEGKAIPTPTWDAIEGAFSAGRPEGLPEAFALALSTPGEASGRFYEIHSHRPGLEAWHPLHVTLEDAITAGRISREWAEQRRLQWGENSALYQRRVLGNFHADDEDVVIPLAWVEAAIERWYEWQREGFPGDDGPQWTGVDVGRGGDLSVLARRRGPGLTLTTKTVRDTMAIVDACVAEPGRCVIDVIGVGAGVYDRLKQMGKKPLAYTGSAKSTRRDRSRQFGFTNARSESYWYLRELLDPQYEPTLCLPPDDLLISDLTTPRWEVTAGVPPKIKIETKEHVVERLGRSPDRGDAVSMACIADAIRAPTGVHTPIGHMPTTGLSPLS